MSEQAVEALGTALKARIEHYRTLDTDDLLQAAIDLIKESDVPWAPHEIISAVLIRVAGVGSVDAVAMMVALGCEDEDVAEALRDLADRSEDVKEGFLLAGLTSIFEEWAEEEIAAGRMMKTVCPKTGKYLYSTVEKPGS